MLKLKIAEQAAVARWKVTRTSPPPMFIKRPLIRRHARTCRTFVESGTYMGATVTAMLPYFDRLISVELDDTLYANAVEQFAHEPKVELHHGDSGQVLGEVVKTLTGPAVFWLDGHYSGEGTAGHGSPILRELPIALSVPGVVLIDDARLFGVEDGYPTMHQVKGAVTAHGRTMSVNRDVITVSPTVS